MSLYESFSSDQSPSENLTTSELKALRLSTIAILHMTSYKSVIEEILNDHADFSNLVIVAVANPKKRINSDLKLLKMKKLLLELFIRTFSQLGLYQLFHMYYKKCIR